MQATQSPAFGLLLRRHRRAAGLTQEELAEQAGLSTRAIGDLERGIRQPRRDTLQMLLEALQLGADERLRLEVAAHALPTAPGSGIGAVQTGDFLGVAPSGPLVGRHQEVKRIRAVLDAVVGGSGRLILLTGEPGVGKTRLAQETALDAMGRGFLVATGRCYEPEGSVPFYPFLEILAAAHGAASRSVRNAVPQRWPSLARLLPEDALTGIEQTGGPWSGEEAEQRLFRSVSGFLGTIAEEMPVALMLDDLHWGDTTSLKLLLHLARHTRGDRVFLLGTYRDVEINHEHPLERALVDLNRERLVERVVVRRLGHEDTSGMITATIGDADPSPELVKLVHDSTSGNPFFIQEVLRALIERGDLYAEQGRWRRRDLRQIRAPETVRAAIGERLSRLPAEGREILYEASVLGQMFSFEDLRAFDRHSDDALEAALEAGVSAGLIREARADLYAFNHALTQQALYEDLPMRRRQRLHLAAGAALSRLPMPGRERRAVELARHFKEGGDVEQAVTYSLLAGERAEAVYAYVEAELHFRTALDLVTREGTESGQDLDDGSLKAAVLAKLGRVLNILDRYDEVLDVLERAVEIYRAEGDREGEGLTLAEIGWVHYARGTEAEGVERIRPVAERLAQGRPSLWECRVLAALYTALARLYFGLGRYHEELTVAERAAELAREVGDPLVQAVAEARLGAALMTVGRRGEATAVLEAACALAEASGNPGTLSVALEHLGEIARDAGDYRRSETLFVRAVEVAEQRGVSSRIAWALTKLGRIQHLQGFWPQARQTFERSLRLLGEDSREAIYPRILLAQVSLRDRGDEDTAAQVERLLREARPRRDGWLLRHGHRLLAEWELLNGRPAWALARLEPLLRQPGAAGVQGGLLYPTLARAHLELGDHLRAEAVLNEGLARVRAQDHCLAKADLLRVQGMVRGRQGRWAEARQSLDEAIDLAVRFPDPYRQLQARAEAGVLATQMGETEIARQQWREAEALAERLGARPYMQRIQLRLASMGV